MWRIKSTVAEIKDFDSRFKPVIDISDGITRVLDSGYSGETIGRGRGREKNYKKEVLEYGVTRPRGVQLLLKSTTRGVKRWAKAQAILRKMLHL